MPCIVSTLLEFFTQATNISSVLTILATVFNFTQQSKSDPHGDKAIEWYTLRDRLDHWNLSVKDKGFMDPISAFAEDGTAS